MVRVQLTQGLERTVKYERSALAIVDGDVQRTWGEFHARVCRLAGALQKLGVAEGDRVAILAQNCSRYLEAYYAICWAGGVFVPLNTRLAQPEIKFQIEDAGARVLFFGEEFEDTGGWLQDQVTDPLYCVAMDGSPEPRFHDYETLIEGADPVANTTRRGDELAGIFYTGGTTGLPKGVMLSHENLYAMSINMVLSLEIGPMCVNLHSAPMFHVSAVGIFFTTILGGVHVFTRDLGAESLIRQIVDHKVTHCFTVPAIIERLTRHPLSATADTSSLQILGYGGSPMPVPVMEAARQRFPNVGLAHGYGMTEMPSMTLLSPADHLPDAPPERLRSVGRAMYTYDIEVVDEQGNRLPPGEVGEIVGRGPNVMMGYWNRPEETAKALRGGWMHSQDVGYLDEDGYIFISDRIKDMILTGAENVYSIEVENALYKHPDVKECAVIGLPDSQWGERVHAVVVPEEGTDIDGETLRRFCRQYIAGYKCPKSVDLRTEPLPRTPVGKVMKNELRAAYAQLETG